MWEITTTYGNHISSVDYLEGQIWRVRHKNNKIGKTQATLLTLIFIIPGDNHPPFHPSIIIHVCWFVWNHTRSLWKSKYSHQVGTFEPMVYICPLFQKYHWTIHTWCTPNPKDCYWKIESLQFFSCWGLSLLQIIFSLPWLKSNHISSTSMYADFLGITQDPSGKQYLVNKLVPMSLGCTVFPFAKNITGPFTPDALPTRRTVI